MPSSFSKHSLARTGTKTQRNRVTFNEHAGITPFNKHLSIQDMGDQDMMSMDHFTPVKKKKKRKKSQKRKHQTRMSAKNPRRKPRSNPLRNPRSKKHTRKSIQQKARDSLVNQRRRNYTAKR